MRLSVILPTCGRPTLENAVVSVLNQMIGTEDELIVIGSREPDPLIVGVSPHMRYLHYDNGGCRTDSSSNSGPPGSMYGPQGPESGAREVEMGFAAARGDFVMIIGDDDIMMRDALKVIHRIDVPVENQCHNSCPNYARPNPNSIHLFRMMYGVKGQWVSPHAKEVAGRFVLWGEPKMDIGNIGGSMFVVPNNQFVPRYRRFGKEMNLAEDFHFIIAYCSLSGSNPVWHEEPIVIIKPSSDDLRIQLGMNLPTPQYAPQQAVNWDGKQHEV